MLELPAMLPQFAARCREETVEVVVRERPARSSPRIRAQVEANA
jgi:hypothetical protein